MADGSWGATLIEKERGKHREKGGLCVHPILSNPAQVLRDPGLSSVVAAWTEVGVAGWKKLHWPRETKTGLQLPSRAPRLRE